MSVKSIVKQIPGARVLRRAVAPTKRALYQFERRDLRASPDPARDQIINLLNYTKTNEADYSAKTYPAGYHTFEINGELIIGRRNPAERLAKVPYDFSGKSVLDIGANQGGMLFELQSTIAHGIGIDVDYRLVNAANAIKQMRSAENLSFFVFNLEQDPLDLLRDMVPTGRVDIVFLLAVCMWIRNWREVIDFCAAISDTMLFESNGSAEQQASQIAHLRQRYGNVEMLSATSTDDEKAKRSLYLCH